jgi:uncharacterized membrane protein
MINKNFIKWTFTGIERKSVLLLQAFVDFLFTFFPMIVLMFVLLLRDGNTYTIAASSDLAFLIATLYAETAWRGRAVNPISFWLPIGMIGAVLSSVAAALNVFSAKEGGEFSALKNVINGEYYLILILILYFFALIFAVAVRFIPLWAEDDKANPWPHEEQK